jgi:tetratricopeptide (TPR) repeat protein
MNETNIKELLNKASQLEKDDNLEEATTFLHFALELNPSCNLAYQQLGDIFFKQKDLEKALNFYNQAIKIDSNLALVQYNVAEIHRSQNRAEEAIKHYTKAIQLEPFNNSPFIQLMFMQVESHQLDEVAFCYQELSKTNPNNPWVDVKLGNVLTKQGKIEKAIASYQNATYKMTQKFNPEYVAKHWQQAKPAEPSFIIIGPMKTATSALYEYINQHPLVLSCIEKEVHFFNDQNKFSQGKDWYTAHFPLIPEGENFITGEASPGYIVNNIQERVFKMFPKIKAIALIRNPIDRAFSHYQHNVKHGFERRTFQEAIFSELEVLKSVENPAEAAKKWHWGAHPGYVLIGCYFYFLKQWLDVFPQQQILILNNQQLLVNPEATMKEVFSFLELPDYTLMEYPKHNSGSYKPLDDNIKQKLADVFRPHNRKLEELLNQKLNWD